MHRPIRLVLAGLAVAAPLATAVAARATTATGNQDPAYRVTASLPDTARRGDAVTATGSVTNTTGAARTVRIVLTLKAPDGTVLARQAQTVTIAAHGTVADDETAVLPPGAPSGTYKGILVARDAGGASRAVARMTVS